MYLIYSILTMSILNYTNAFFAVPKKNLSVNWKRRDKPIEREKRSKRSAGTSWRNLKK